MYRALKSQRGSEKEEPIRENGRSKTSSFKERLRMEETTLSVEGNGVQGLTHPLDAVLERNGQREECSGSGG